MRLRIERTQLSARPVRQSVRVVRERLKGGKVDIVEAW
jgi:hypothetical protein